MKAYVAWDNTAVEDYHTIVFAENTQEARKIVFSCEVCEDAEWINVKVKRKSQANNLYKGHSEMDWYNPETRLALVRDLGWACLDIDSTCDTCTAKIYCRHWEGENETETT